MLFDAFAVAPAVLIVVLFEIVSVMYIYGNIIPKMVYLIYFGRLFRIILF